MGTINPEINRRRGFLLVLGMCLLIATASVCPWTAKDTGGKVTEMPTAICTPLPTEAPTPTIEPTATPTSYIEP